MKLKKTEYRFPHLLTLITVVKQYSLSHCAYIQCLAILNVQQALINFLPHGETQLYTFAL